MTDYRTKLRRLAAQPIWKRLVFAFIVNVVLFWKHAGEFYAYLNANFPRFDRRFKLRRVPRPLAHWVQVERADRVATMTFTLAVLAGMLILEMPYSLYWAIGWGSLLSVLVTYRSLTILISRIKRTTQNQTRSRTD